MNQQPPENMADPFIQAQETIAHQAREIELLRLQLEREQFARELSRLLLSAKAINIVLSPFTHSQLLETVVRTAAQVIRARSASLFLIDEETQNLIFEVAIGPAAQEVKKFRIPMGHGIAGIVAMTGQPMAIADAQQDERLAIDIATSVNYIPQNILCVPLFYNDCIIGALELLDKIDEASFRPFDMETLGLFANMAAVAIAQSQAYHDQQTFLASLLDSFGEMSAESKQQLSRKAFTFSNWMQGNSVNTTARELALLVHELLQFGEQEGEMCKNILQSFATGIRAHQGLYDTLVD
jgi:transcriptional regulator with GAF, ATPase, and Fis domain